MRTLVILICVFACGILVAAGQAQKSQLTGLVIDSTDAVVPKAHIFVLWDSSGSEKPQINNVGIKQEIRLTTDDYGMFRSEIPPGFYDVFVSSSGFSPGCQKVYVKENQRSELRFVLKPDPLTEGANTYTIIDPK